ncbi:DUF1361 domain-containing protein [Candidatus Nomurabacteria bacterium]|nr:DUF1361 domain-containing protein [Candidatus Nomurabacteria bacterium]
MLKKFKIPNGIVYLLSLAVFLNILRIFLFGSTTFVYMFWNIFLASVPFFISLFLLGRTNKDNITKPIFIIGFIFWFLFLPNAPYVITDFIHLGRIHAVPVMYDMFLLFASASVSLLMGLYSIHHMEKMLLLKFTRKIANIIIIVTIFFASFGVYLGRYLRFNSWDLFISHNSLISSICKVFTQSNAYANVYGYTLLFFIFIYISYKSFQSSI